MMRADTRPRRPALLHDACRCRIAAPCLTCRRFHRYFVQVQRRLARRAQA